MEVVVLEILTVKHEVVRLSRVYGEDGEIESFVIYSGTRSGIYDAYEYKLKVVYRLKIPRGLKDMGAIDTNYAGLLIALITELAELLPSCVSTVEEEGLPFAPAGGCEPGGR